MSGEEEVSKNLGGRPPYQPTKEARALVEVMVAGGIEQAHISAAIGISLPTLRKHFRSELDAGMAKANAKVVANFYKQATKDDFKSISAGKFWLQNRLGWTDRHSAEVSGPAGAPVQNEITVRLIKSDADTSA